MKGKKRFLFVCCGSIHGICDVVLSVFGCVWVSSHIWRGLDKLDDVITVFLLGVRHVQQKSPRQRDSIQYTHTSCSVYGEWTNQSPIKSNVWTTRNARLSGVSIFRCIYPATIVVPVRCVSSKYHFAWRSPSLTHLRVAEEDYGHSKSLDGQNMPWNKGEEKKVNRAYSKHNVLD